MRNEHKKIERVWKEYNLSPPATRLGNYASINPNGRIAFNQNMWMAMGSPKAVTLLHDEQHETIGVRPVSPITPNSFAVAHYDKGTRIWVRAHGFLSAAGIALDYCIRFTDPHVEDGILILDLHHTTRVIGARTKPKRPS